MKYTPRLDYVLVLMDAPKEKSGGGILLPETARDDRVPGEVIAIGPGRITEYGHTITVRDLAKGDRVIFNKFTAYELSEDERLYLIRGSDISCKVNDE
jgi:chaperonin GroES